MNPLSGVLDEAWRMYRAHAAHLLTIAFVIYLVTAVIVALFALIGGIVGFLVSLAIMTTRRRTDVSYRRDGATYLEPGPVDPRV